MELPDDMLMAKMDARLIVQVVINIVNNAIKYTPPGSHVQVSARKRGESVEVRIADDGPGISDEAKAKLFDMFYTANNARGDGGWACPCAAPLCRPTAAPSPWRTTIPRALSSALHYHLRR